MTLENPANPFVGIEPIVKADALMNGVFERRDPEAMGRFLVDFGFVPVGQDGESHFYRGFGDAPYCVEIVRGDTDRCIGFGLLAEREDDLETLSRATGSSVTDSKKPGGGRHVELVDPNGFTVTLGFGVQRVAELPHRNPIENTNTPGQKRRIDQGIRPPSGPAPIRGIGHIVFQTPAFDETVRWYMRHFGYLPSDLLSTPNGHIGLGFFRFNRGKKPADHHSLALLAGPAVQMMHISTETIDLDAVGQGQQHLRAQGWIHHWGIGRHILGSQIFDYWKDPAGDEWEHYADGDVMTASYPVGHHKLDRGGLWAWGHDLPDGLRPPGPAPAEAPDMVRELVDALLIAPRPWLD